MKTKVKTLSVRKQRQPDGSLSNIKLKMYKYQCSNNENISVEKVYKRAQEIANQMKKEKYNAEIQVKIKIPKLGVFRSGRFTDIREKKLNVYNPHDYDEEYDTMKDTKKDRIHDEVTKWYDNGKGLVNDFIFYVVYKPTEGGCSENSNNDCFYHCIQTQYPSKVFELWKWPSCLKKFLQIKRDDKVNVFKHVDKIEKKLGAGIYIHCDYERQPSKEFKQYIHIDFKNGHFTNTKHKRNFIKINTLQERKVQAVHYNNKNGIAYSYDGIKFEEMPISDKRKELKDKIVLKCDDENELKTEYDLFIQQADLLKEKTQGLINMYRSGNIKDTALSLFSFYNSIIETENVFDVEKDWILNCYRAGIRLCKEYEGPAYKYDYCSRYSSLMMGKYSFPVKKGEFLKLINFDEWKNENGKQYFKFGIYRCKISGNIDSALFRRNNLNYYTHIDLDLAYNLGYKIELKNDGFNFLYYSPDKCVSGERLFKQYVELLFGLKKENITYAKSLLNILWGALCEKATFKSKSINTEKIEDVEDDNIMDEDEHIVDINQYNDNEIGIEYCKYNSYFKTNYARISPFLTALARRELTKFITKHNIETKDIYWIHTDSIITPIKLDDIKNKDDCEIGEMGYEGFCENIQITNKGHVGKFVIE